MLRRQCFGPARICVRDSGDLNIAETRQDLSVPRGDITGTYHADTGSGDHNPAYPTVSRKQTTMFEGAWIGQMSPTVT
ncbi:hypothetical protein ACTMTF_13490 [Nonomuraea sp. ZG12]|uniref:hypothetical protein n=1 Tax=Nonomuraea sp. ZG12 TaxID=3452207 RepID=UPI003F8A7B5E